MEGGLLSLKWNNHRSSFFHLLSTLRHKEIYSDVTLACEEKFYPSHKMVLSTCSEYFECMFERTQGKHPIIVLNDIKCDDLEALLNYMYFGEVNVVQEKLSGLIKAAECLRIKGLAVPDEPPSSSGGREKRTHSTDLGSEGKRRKLEGESVRHRNSHDLSSKSPSVNKSDSDKLTDSSNVRHPDSSPTRKITSRVSDTESHSNQSDKDTNYEESEVLPQVKEEPQEQVFVDELEDSKDFLMQGDNMNYMNVEGSSGGGTDMQDSADMQGWDSSNNLEGSFDFDPSASSNAGGSSQAGSMDSFTQGAPGPIVWLSASNGSKDSDSGAHPSGTRTLTSATMPLPDSCRTLEGHWVCPICSKDMGLKKSNLQQHYSIHLGFKPFACPMCLYRSVQKSNLKQHISNIHFRPPHMRSKRSSSSGVINSSGATDSEVASDSAAIEKEGTHVLE